MSSPIAIPAVNSTTHYQSAHSPNMTPRSLPGNSNGLYVPVHRRGGSTSSVSSISSSSSERGSLSPIARPTHGRMRSVSPMPRTPRSPRAFNQRHLDVSLAPSSHAAAHIPLASMIPNTYTISQLLALSSEPAPFSQPRQERIDAHIPFMTRKPKSSSPSSSAPSPSPASSSPKSSPVSEITALPTAPAPAHAPKSNPDAQKTRRRRPGRKNSSGRPRVAPALGTDVEERRRRYGTNWGWIAHVGSGGASEQENWRSHAVAVVA